MTPDQIAAIINLGGAGAVIATVIYFLRYISKRDDKDKERDQQWQAFFKALLENKDAPIIQVAEILQTFFREWQQHDTWERTKLEGMEKTISATNEPASKTRPRRPAADK